MDPADIAQTIRETVEDIKRRAGTSAQTDPHVRSIAKAFDMLAQAFDEKQRAANAEPRRD